MKLPRFSLRTLFVLVTLASIPMGWVAYQFYWIHQRHAFRANPNVIPFNPGIVNPAHTPWQLKLLGEYDPECYVVPPELVDEARALFPGVGITTPDIPKK